MIILFCFATCIYFSSTLMSMEKDEIGLFSVLGSSFPGSYNSEDSPKKEKKEKDKTQKEDLEMSFVVIERDNKEKKKKTETFDNICRDVKKIHDAIENDIRHNDGRKESAKWRDFFDTHEEKRLTIIHNLSIINHDMNEMSFKTQRLLLLKKMEVGKTFNNLINLCKQYVIDGKDVKQEELKKRYENFLGAIQYFFGTKHAYQGRKKFPIYYANEGQVEQLKKKLKLQKKQFEEQLMRERELREQWHKRDTVGWSMLNNEIKELRKANEKLSFE
ncbi:MAG TPA: hypothetical protein VEK38_02060, partial [Candidatus Bathyarchaeia archaeon]|nr:hypothetical protein [Candidatus Bathyarchaeia archaeon]